MSGHLRRNNKVNQFTECVIERDINQRGYLSKQLIQDCCQKNGYRFDAKQVNTLLSALDTNTQGDYNYFLLFELLFGPEEAQKIRSGKNTSCSG